MINQIFFVAVVICLFLYFIAIIIACATPSVGSQEIKKLETWGVYYNSHIDTFIVLFDPQKSGNQCLRKRGNEKAEVGCYVGLGYWSDSVIVKFGDDIYKFDAPTENLILQTENGPLLFGRGKMMIREFLRDKI